MVVLSTCLWSLGAFHLNVYFCFLKPKINDQSLQRPIVLYRWWLNVRSFQFLMHKQPTVLLTCEYSYTIVSFSSYSLNCIHLEKILNVTYFCSCAIICQWTVFLMLLIISVILAHQMMNLDLEVTDHVNVLFSRLPSSVHMEL